MQGHGGEMFDTVTHQIVINQQEGSSWNIYNLSPSCCRFYSQYTSVFTTFPFQYYRRNYIHVASRGPGMLALRANGTCTCSWTHMWRNWFDGFHCAVRSSNGYARKCFQQGWTWYLYSPFSKRNHGPRVKGRSQSAKHQFIPALKNKELSSNVIQLSVDSNLTINPNIGLVNCFLGICLKKIFVWIYLYFFFRNPSWD